MRSLVTGLAAALVLSAGCSSSPDSTPSDEPTAAASSASSAAATPTASDAPPVEDTAQGATAAWDQLTDETFTVSAKAGYAKFTSAHVDFESRGEKAPDTMTFVGDVSLDVMNDKVFRGAYGMGSVSMEVVSVGEGKVWAKGPAVKSETWVDLADDDPASMGPRMMLMAIPGMLGNLTQAPSLSGVTAVGKEDVNGAPAMRYKALMEDSLPVEIWVNEDVAIVKTTSAFHTMEVSKLSAEPLKLEPPK